MEFVPVTIEDIEPENVSEEEQYKVERKVFAIMKKLSIEKPQGWITNLIMFYLLFQVQITKRETYCIFTKRSI